ncbi:unnamed protein product, partial [Prorocentrum cordatum]
VEDTEEEVPAEQADEAQPAEEEQAEEKPPEKQPAEEEQALADPEAGQTQGEIAELLASQEQPACILRKKICDPLAKGIRITYNGTMITCANCRVRDQTLRRIFGGWPIAEFDELRNEEQDGFYKECGCTAAACRDAVKHMLMQVRRKRITDTHSGQYLPLSVYEKLGYNTDDIEQKTAAADIEDHPVLGKTRRVVTHSISGARIREVTRQEEGEEAACGKLPGQKPEKKLSSKKRKSGSSSSSDSSSDKKKKKKGAQSRKGKRSKKSKKSNKGKKSKTEAEGELSGSDAGLSPEELLAKRRAKVAAEKKAAREAEKQQELLDKELAKEQAAQKREEQKKRTKGLQVVHKVLAAVKPLLKKTATLLADDRLKKAPKTHTGMSGKKQEFLNVIAKHCNSCLEDESMIPEIKENEVKTAVSYMATWMKTTTAA